MIVVSFCRKSASSFTYLRCCSRQSPLPQAPSIVVAHAQCVFWFEWNHQWFNLSPPHYFTMSESFSSRWIGFGEQRWRLCSIPLVPISLGSKLESLTQLQIWCWMCFTEFGMIMINYQLLWGWLFTDAKEGHRPPLGLPSDSRRGIWSFSHRRHHQPQSDANLLLQTN